MAINVQKLFYCLNIYLRINFPQRQWNESRTTLPYRIKAMRCLRTSNTRGYLIKTGIDVQRNLAAIRANPQILDFTVFQFLYTTACWENNYARTRKIWLLWNPPVCSFHVLICKYAELSGWNQQTSDHFHDKSFQHIHYILSATTQANYNIFYRPNFDLLSR